MKKWLFFLIGMMLFLVACNDNASGNENTELESSNDTEEVSAGEIEEESDLDNDLLEFISDFNSIASSVSALEKIEVSDVGDLEEQQRGYSRIIYSSARYTITAVYDDSNGPTGYAVTSHNVHGENRYSATYTVAEVLGLDREALENEIQIGTESSSHSYRENAYDISVMHNIEEMDEEATVIVGFMYTGTEAEDTEVKDDGGEQSENEEIEIYSDEVKEFVESFNQLASLEDDIDLIEEIQPAEESENGYSQTLYSSDEYIIIANYQEDGEINSYIVVIPDDQPYRELKGNGLYAMFHVATALDLDLEELGDEFEKALPNHAGMYFADDYTISFHTDEQLPEMGITIMFMNATLSDDE
ncbi:hypothetical protein [Oceanobacillus jeddahense]|uniref:hypothetical protein n=1 Tax=Oceanobacillus jeddahense TaxID=1462527 RepID=UPI00059626B3|nr:hypothetical protein [Oceanobacillus jeddahense]